MSVFDKIMNAMRLNDEDDEYDEEYYDEEEEYDDQPVFSRKNRRFSGGKSESDEYYDDEESYDEFEAPKKEPKRIAAAKITSIRSRRSEGSVSSGSRAQSVRVVRPTSVDEARDIADTLIRGEIVILNLEGIDLDVGQRIIDFASGSCYTIDGNLQKLSGYIFVVTPKNVDITGDIQNLVGSLDSSIHMDF